MDTMSELLRPTWGAEKWISEGWQKITSEEKKLITDRMNDLFKDGLPFEIKHDKLLYIHTFSFLAQLEVLAIQIPLRFEDKMSNPEFKKQMRRQLLDEIFHGMVFTKIIYLLCAPYAEPPEYNENIEKLCNFIREEECPKVGVVLLNLVAEGWIEELFSLLYQENVAPKVFKVILEDEHRHVCEADLYKDIGMPDQKILAEKLKTLEETMISALTLEPKYLTATSELLNRNSFMQILNEKHIKQLKKIQMRPSKRWRLFVRMGNFTRKLTLKHDVKELEFTPIKQIFLTQWNETGDPVMTGNFDIDVSRLKLSEKIYPSSTVTTLTLQAISKMLHDNPELRNCLNHNKTIQVKDATVSLVVQLPGCNDHLSNIVFTNCHEMPIEVVTLKIKQIIKIMTYCYKLREQMEHQHPHLKLNLDKFYADCNNKNYPYPMSAPGFVSVSNIGFCGFNQGASPLRKHEALKFTLLTVKKAPVWSESTQTFEARDLLPVSVSADHRVIDGNNPAPIKLNKAFDSMFEQMSNQGKFNLDNIKDLSTTSIDKLESIFQDDIELRYRLLSILQSIWDDVTCLDEIIDLTESSLESI